MFDAVKPLAQQCKAFCIGNQAPACLDGRLLGPVLVHVLTVVRSTEYNLTSWLPIIFSDACMCLERQPQVTGGRQVHGQVTRKSPDNFNPTELDGNLNAVPSSYAPLQGRGTYRQMFQIQLYSSNTRSCALSPQARDIHGLPLLPTRHARGTMTPSIPAGRWHYLLV